MCKIRKEAREYIDAKIDNYILLAAQRKTMLVESIRHVATQRILREIEGNFVGLIEDCRHVFEDKRSYPHGPIDIQHGLSLPDGGKGLIPVDDYLLYL